MPVILLAKIPAVDAAAADRIAKHLEKIRAVSTSDKEPGCSTYNPSRSTTDPLQFMVYEEYADQAAVDAHMAGEPFQALAAEIGELVPGGMQGLDLSFWTRF